MLHTDLILLEEGLDEDNDELLKSKIIKKIKQLFIDACVAKGDNNT